MFKVLHQAPDLKALTKDSFVADMHFHTEHSHDCQTPVKDIVRRARRLGIHVALTDHNRVGGVLEASQHAGAQVIPGIEVCAREGKEVIAYFFDQAQLEEFHKKLTPFCTHKNAMRSTRTKLPMADLLAMLKEEQCVIHLPHPFAPQPRRSYSYLARRRTLLDAFDSVEVLNQQMTPRANLAAAGWAVQLGKGVAGGSDGHALKRLGQVVTCSAATSVEEHLEHIRKGRVQVVGTEMRPAERVINFTQTTVKSKIENGLVDGLRRLTLQEDEQE